MSQRRIFSLQDENIRVFSSRTVGKMEFIDLELKALSGVPGKQQVLREHCSHQACRELDWDRVTEIRPGATLSGF